MSTLCLLSRGNHVCICLFVHLNHTYQFRLQATYAQKWWHWQEKESENLHVCCWTRTHSHTPQRDKNDFCLKQYLSSHIFVSTSDLGLNWCNSAVTVLEHNAERSIFRGYNSHLAASKLIALEQSLLFCLWFVLFFKWKKEKKTACCYLTICGRPFNAAEYGCPGPDSRTGAFPRFKIKTGPDSRPMRSQHLHMQHSNVKHGLWRNDASLECAQHYAPLNSLPVWGRPRNLGEGGSSSIPFSPKTTILCRLDYRSPPCT